MESKAKLFGHPIHTAVIVFPLGLLMGAVFFDFCGLTVSTTTNWFEISYWMMGLGIVTGLFAAAFGLIDWINIPSETRAKKIGLIHGVGNVLVVGLMALSFSIRTADPALVPNVLALLCSFAGAGLLMITGWLGGELVNRLGIWVTPGAHPNAPSSYVP